MHCIQGSDATGWTAIPIARAISASGTDRPRSCCRTVSFRALKALFASNEFDRTRPFAPPPDDPIKAARLDGNTATQSFHESAASKRSHSAVLRDVVAFANAGGGRIYLGVSAAEKRPVCWCRGDPTADRGIDAGTHRSGHATSQRWVRRIRLRWQAGARARRDGGTTNRTPWPPEESSFAAASNRPRRRATKSWPW